MMKKVKTVEEYFDNLPNSWIPSINKLRRILLKKNLNETIKWGTPVYTFNGKNIVGIGAFKSYVGLWFFQGALLTDPHNKLINAQKEKTKALRQWRFTDERDMDENLIISYVEEAIANQEKGLEIKPTQKNYRLKIPKELKAVLQNNMDLSACFEKLTISKKREYAEYILEAKRVETKQKRIEKITPMILHLQGLNDRYRKK